MSHSRSSMEGYSAVPPYASKNGFGPFRGRNSAVTGRTTGALEVEENSMKRETVARGLRRAVVAVATASLLIGLAACGDSTDQQ